jgi:hypothetical protein
MISQLNLFASVLVSLDANIAHVCSGETCTPYGTQYAEASKLILDVQTKLQTVMSKYSF